MSFSARLSPGLERLVAAVRKRGAATLSSSELGDVLAEVSLSYEDIADWARFDNDNYCRNLVISSGNFEIRVICWLPRQRTSLHGHHGAGCAFRIVAGVSTEIRLRQVDRQWTPGTVVREEGTTLVHQVTNLGDAPLVSVHLYSPPLPVEQPPRRYAGKQIVIVGGGVSGVALAIHLLRSVRQDLRIAIIERRQWLGRGPAYGTADPGLRLNVPAERMSLFPAEPQDFVTWARAQGTTVEAAALLSRQLYGDYVEDRLASAIREQPGKVWLYRAEAVAANANGVQLKDGLFVQGSAVVLAISNQVPSPPAAMGPELLRSNRVVANPWSSEALQAIEPDEDVLVLGTGLTAVDVLLGLRAQAHRGRIVALSHHGLLPRAHLPLAEYEQAKAVDFAALPGSLRELVRWVRDGLERAEGEGLSWQHVIDGLRPHVSALWQRFSASDRRRFVNRVRRYWDSARHRAAPDALRTLELWSGENRLEVVAGHIEAMREDEEGFDVTLRCGGKLEHRRFGRVVLCTGPETDVRRWKSPLFQQLISDGLIRPDPLALGVDTDDEGRVLGPRGEASPWLFTLGALRRPQLWETTAVPDIVKQAARLVGPLAQAARLDVAPPR